MHAVVSPELRPARLGLLWFGVQMVWGAILAVSLQARSVELAPVEGVAAYAVLAAVGALVGAVVQLIAGPLSDRRRAVVGHRREFYAAGVILAGVAVIGFYGAWTFAQLASAFVLLQIAVNVATGPYQAIIPDYIAPERAGRASSWMSGLQSGGNAVGLLVAGFVSNTMLVGLILALVLTLTYSLTDAHVRGVTTRSQEIAPIRLDAPLRTLLASRGAINVGFYTLLGFLFFFVRDSLHVADVRTQTALVFLTFTLCGIGGAALGARPADRYDKRLVVSLANAVVAVALVALALAPGLPLAYVAAAFAGVAWGAFFTADWALACIVLPQGAMGTAMGIWNLAATVPQVIAPLVTAPLVAAGNRYQAGVGPRLAIGLAILEFTLGALWLWRLPDSVVRPVPAGAPPATR